jgi:hypothetical protein
LPSTVAIFFRTSKESKRKQHRIYQPEIESTGNLEYEMALFVEVIVSRRPTVVLPSVSRHLNDRTKSSFFFQVGVCWDFSGFPTISKRVRFP